MAIPYSPLIQQTAMDSHMKCFMNFFKKKATKALKYRNGKPKFVEKQYL